MYIFVKISKCLCQMTNVLEQVAKNICSNLQIHLSKSKFIRPNSSTSTFGFAVYLICSRIKLFIDFPGFPYLPLLKARNIAAVESPSSRLCSHLNLQNVTTIEDHVYKMRYFQFSNVWGMFSIDVGKMITNDHYDIRVRRIIGDAVFYGSRSCCHLDFI